MVERILSLMHEVKLELNTYVKRALSRNQVKLSFLLAINCLIPDIIANVIA